LIFQAFASRSFGAQNKIWICFAFPLSCGCGLLWQLSRNRLKSRNPYALHPLEIITVNSYQIKTAGWRLGKPEQIKGGSTPQSLLLNRANTGCGAAKMLVFAGTDFNKDQRLFIAHNQVNFTRTAAKIFFDQRQTLLLKENQCACFSIPTQRNRARLPSIMTGRHRSEPHEVHFYTIAQA
jgi:hypothetical protein